jgi:hypothetical protein
MQFSVEPAHDDKHLIDYLLGLLPEDETERLDEASLVDDAFAARLRNVENDLVDAYVAGSLAHARRTEFEAFYLASPRRREKVEFARRFLAAVDRAATPVAVAIKPSAAQPVRFIRWWQAAAAALLVTCGALTYQNARLRVAMDDAARQVATSTQRESTMTRQLEEARAAAAQSTRVPASTNSTVSEKWPAPIGRGSDLVSSRAPVAIVLLPQTRSLVPLPTVAVARGADRVAFELRVEMNDFDRYEVALKDPVTNRTLWRSGKLTASAHDGAVAVRVSLPARLLDKQRYVFELSGVADGEQPEVSGNYVFQVAVM